MLSYYDVMTMDYSHLTKAAAKWDEMAGEFKKVEEKYRDSVQKITMGPNWIGESAIAAHTNFAATRYEYKAAQTQAKATASLLRDAHTQFLDLKKKVEAARDDAIAAGMKVSEQGSVTLDQSKLTEGARNALRHDPDYMSSTRKAEQSWVEHIKAAVKAVVDHDQGVKLALEAVVVDSIGDKNDETLGTGFNNHANGDIEHYEAENTADIATRLNNGEKVSAAELAELQRSFRDNADNKAFSQTFLNSMGADGVIKFTNTLNDHAYGSDKKHKSQYLDIQTGMANTVARATRVPGNVAGMPPGSAAFKKWEASSDGKFYREWMQELDKTGTKNYGSNTQPLYGYQSFVGMMQQADVKYDDQFLYDLGDDLIAAEKKHPGIFTQVGAPHHGVRSDAIDGLLDVMSKNPDAATAFFDPASGPDRPGSESNNDHLKYLAGHGDNTRDWPNIYVSGTTFDDPLSRMGLGVALEAAATGQPPLKPGQDPWPAMPHTESQARVMHGLIGELGPGPGEGTDASIHQNLRGPVSHALAQYTADTHEILGGVSADYVTSSVGDGFFKDEDGVHMSVKKDQLIQVMRGLSEDPDAYGTLHKAESRYIDMEMQKIPDGAINFENSGTLGKSGAALGTYSAIREDVINSERMDAYSSADWKSKVAYHVIGGAVAPITIPTAAGGGFVVGELLQRGVDTWAWEWGNSMKADADNVANAQIADVYLKAENQTPIMTQQWAADRTDIDINTKAGKDRLESLTNVILDGQTRGSDSASKYL
ncbi:hypothetical protein ACFY7Z_07380 [Streptomyces sp. NPDC012623]|uniref:hypothetical protein n=1 Tax=unclassified Streptomyces TaxID=2593676 RepID=UPI0036B32ABC